jgi:hypothetical protein
MDPLYFGNFRTTICYQALRLPYYMLHLSVNSKLQSFPQLLQHDLLSNCAQMFVCTDTGKSDSGRANKPLPPVRRYFEH